MKPAPTPEDWTLVVNAAKALLIQGLASPDRAFLRAVRALKAAALVLLFALARTLAPSDPGKGRPLAAPSGGERCGGRPVRSALHPDRWRNPPVTAFQVEPVWGASGPVSSGSPTLDPVARAARAVAVLKALLILCAAPDAYARKLARRIVVRDPVLIAAEVKAFAVNAREQDRRTREAWRFLRRDRRRRRRRDSS